MMTLKTLAGPRRLSDTSDFVIFEKLRKTLVERDVSACH